MMDDLKKVHQDTTTMEKINSITSNVTTTLRADAPMFSKHYNANEELNKSREINIVTPDYNHLRYSYT